MSHTCRIPVSQEKDALDGETILSYLVIALLTYLLQEEDALEGEAAAARLCAITGLPAKYSYAMLRIGHLGCDRWEGGV